jgi:hypothetical protein
MLSALTAEDGDRCRALAAPDESFRFWANAVRDACNWLVPADGPDAFCRACRLNRTIHNLDAPENLLLWRRLEAGKHRLDNAVPPKPDRFMADVDVALEQQIFDLRQRQRIADIHQRREADHFGRAVEIAEGIFLRTSLRIAAVRLKSI